MSTRAETTRKLRELVVKRLESQHMYWSPEVEFDKYTDRERRVDFVGFAPYTIDGVVTPASVEQGGFDFYEVKSCMDDFDSGHGLTFYGTGAYLVCTPELAEQLYQSLKLPAVDAVLVPNKNWTKLKTEFKPGKHSSIFRSASEMLWAIVQSHERDPY